MQGRPSKYNARKAYACNGEICDSGREARRLNALLRMQEDGQISGLRRQVAYELIPQQREPDTIGPKGGVHKGRVIEKACAYKADFVYMQDGQEVVEDCKGARTEVYRIKKKLMLYRHGIRIKET